MIPRDQAGGRSDVLRVERASATPNGGVGTRRRRGTARLPSTLRGQLAWFQEAVTAPTAPAADGALSRPDLLEVYRYAYRARLEEALDDDFEAVRVPAGARWPRLVAGYLRDCPPVSRTLNDYGARFPGWLRARRLGLLADLATLEWALVEVLHAPAAPVLDRAALARVPLAAWAKARFAMAGTLRVVTSPWPVNDVLAAVRAGEVPPRPRRQASVTVVYRRDFDLWRQPLSAQAHGVLAALMAGQTLGQALATVPEDEAPEVLGWFSHWVACGFFAAVRLPRGVSAG